MWPAVRLSWPAWIATFEGRCAHPYLDQHKDPKTGRPDPLVTSAIGLLCDPVSLMLDRPWRILEGGALVRLATASEITQGFLAVKSHPELAPLGGGSPRFAALTNLRLSEADIDTLTESALDEYEREALPYFPEMATRWPCAAQRGIFAMLWALGTRGLVTSFPRFRALANALDFAGAAAESHISNARPARNAATRALFEEAAVVVASGLPLDRFIDFPPIPPTSTPPPAPSDPPPDSTPPPPSEAA
jgi:hypothetical protein